MVTAEDMATRREEIAASDDLRRLLERLIGRAAPVLERAPVIPEHKALLSKDGGICPRDGAPLVFDPFSPSAHRCPRCGERYKGERHDRHWARYQHLWVAERAAHLASFIDGYARFAKLPRPLPAAVSWAQFLARLEGTLPFRLEGAPPAEPARFDAGQLEQVMINLLKNAAESGSAPGESTVAVRAASPGVRIEVGDRGGGLSASALRDALLPFYSTKPAGTGLGLTLCREIVEAHGGRLSLANRPGGGVLVTVWLP